MKILVINGPNLNMLGIREPEIYGSKNYNDLEKFIKKSARELKVRVECWQSNLEGEIVELIQEAYYQKFDGIVINPAGYTHTSVVILDALKAANVPTIEVHISNTNEREEFRKFSYIRDYCIESIIGEGFDGYSHALKDLKKYLESKKNGNK